MSVAVGEVEITGSVRLAPESAQVDGIVLFANDLSITVLAFYYDFGATKGRFGGALNQAIVDDDTNYVYLDSAGALQINVTGYPGIPHIRLARVFAAGGVGTRIVLERAFLSSSGAAAQVVSQVGEFTVPAPVAIGDLVYVTGTNAADQADNSGVGTSPGFGIVIGKPTGTTATLAYSGAVDIPGGSMTAGALQFMGAAGALIEAGSLPSVAGSVVQQLGIALDADTLLLNPQQDIVL